MRTAARISILAALATLFAACHQPEQPPVPPKPTNPTNRALTADVIDASIVSDAGPLFDVGSFGLEATPVRSASVF